MKLIFKTALLTFVASLSLIITVNQPTQAVAFPVATHQPTEHRRLEPIPITEYKFTKKQKKEIECLAVNMYHEAKGEGGLGWLAVGMVTMNRVKAKRWPNTVCKVVYQNNGRVYQFSWAGSKKRLTKPSGALYNEIYELAIVIYLHHGKMQDVTGNAYFFHADYVNPFWSQKKNRTVKIGRHIFYTL